MLRLGIAGYDHAHIRRVAKWGLQKATHAVQVAAVADPDRQRVAADVQAYGARYYADYHDLLTQPDIDAVLIMTENARHAPMCAEAAQAGKHVLCEKPMCIDLASGRAALQAADEHGVKLATLFVVRHSVAARHLKQVIDSGAIGRIVAINATNHGNGYVRAGHLPWVYDPRLSGGGSVADHTVHCADLIRWLTGSEVAEVYAETATLFRPELCTQVEDAGLLSLRLQNGVIAAIDASWSRLKTFPGFGDLTLRIIGAQGSLFFSFTQDAVRVYGDDPINQAQSYEPDPYQLMFENLAASIEQDLPVLTSGEDGYRASEVFLAAYRSVEAGRPVSLPLDE